MIEFYKVEHRYGVHDEWRESITTTKYGRAMEVFFEALNIYGGEIRLLTFTERSNGDIKVTKTMCVADDE